MKIKYTTNIVISAQAINNKVLNSLFNMVDLDIPRPEQIVPIIVFMAFTVESYINNLAYRHLKSWPECERKPCKEKVKLLHKQLQITTDWNIDSLKFLVKLFELRDLVAHGKPNEYKGPEFESYEPAKNYALTNNFESEWFLSLSSEWYRNSRSNFENLMAYLAVIHKLSPTDYYQVSKVSIRENL